MPAGSERLLEAFRQRGPPAGPALRKEHPEVEDPGGLLQRTCDLVGVLVDHVDAEGLEDREDLRQRHGRAHAGDLEAQVALSAVRRFVDLEGELPRSQPLDDERVVHAAGRPEVLLVGLRVGVRIRAQQVVGCRDPDPRGQLGREVVLPAASGRRHLGLEVVGVDVGQAPADGHVDDVVQAREHGLRDARRVVDADAAERVHEDLLDLEPDRRRVAVARQVHQAGHEPAVVVCPEVQLRAPTLLQVQHRLGNGRELLVMGLEELVTGVGLEEGEQVLRIMGAGDVVQSRLEVPCLHPQDRDVHDGLGVGARRVQAEEPALPDDLAGGVELLHRDVVEVDVAVDRRA